MIEKESIGPPDWNNACPSGNILEWRQIASCRSEEDFEKTEQRRLRESFWCNNEVLRGRL